MKSIRGTVSGLAIAALVTLGSAVRADEANSAPEAHDLATYTCKDVMRMSGPDREYALIALHAWMLGNSGKTTFQSAALSELTDSFIEFCLDHPAEGALASMRRLGTKGS